MSSNRRRRRLLDVQPEVDKLRNAHKVVDPAKTYSVRLPDGSIFQATGAELLETADATVAVADAQLAGDIDASVRALRRLGFDFPKDAPPASA